jgi:membrane protein implicated in regulation of membrane protease activity
MQGGFLTHIVFWHWFAFALILGIIDVVLGANFLFVWCGLAAAIVGVILLIIPSMGWEYQLCLFGIGVFSSLFLWKFYSKRVFKSVKANTLNQRSRQYIGRLFTLESAIKNGMGRIRVDDTIWRVEGPDMPVGTQVKVIDVDGTILKVEKVD